MTSAEEQLSPDERAAAELEKKLNEARGRLLNYASEMFAARGWRVRVTAEWAETGALRLRVKTPIENYFVTIDLSRERLLDANQAFNHEEIDALPNGMIDAVFGGNLHFLLMKA